MDQRLSVITLGVKDLVASLQFYKEVMGWTPASVSNENICFFQIGGLVLSLYPKALLAQDACVEGKGQGFSGMTISHNVSTKQEVDVILRNVQQKGAMILKPAQEVFWGGYSGYFQDPDGYVFEVAWNPFWTLTRGGEVILP